MAGFFDPSRERMITWALLLKGLIDSELSSPTGLSTSLNPGLPLPHPRKQAPSTDTLFTTPDASPTMKLVWAYVTYIMMMTVYTGINVPYGAMLGVMTDDSGSKTVLSSYRMFFAYGGSFIALFCWEPLCNALGGYGTPSGWQHAMFVIAALCLVLFLLCFRMTKEKVKPEATGSVGKDFKSLLRNAPWWLLVGAALCSNLFNTVRGSTIAYFFNDVISQDAHLNLGPLSFVFYAGLFLSIGEVCNMVGVALAVPFSKALGKKTTYVISLIALIVLSISFFYVPVTAYWMMLVLQIVISIILYLPAPGVRDRQRRIGPCQGALHGGRGRGADLSRLYLRDDPAEYRSAQFPLFGSGCMEGGDGF